MVVGNVSICSYNMRGTDHYGGGVDSEFSDLICSYTFRVPDFNACGVKYLRFHRP